MHPKRLLDICIYVIVRLTRDIQLSRRSDKEKLSAVKEMWQELWTLPEHIPVYAGELLHAYLTAHPEQNFSLSFFTALAANLRRIKIESRHNLLLLPVSTYEECYFQSPKYHLQELDIACVNRESDTSVLEEIIPKCTSLKKLNLGSHLKQTLLLLVKKYCPLITVLHMNACSLDAPLDFWMDLFFGRSNVRPTDIVEGIKEGRTNSIRVTWPNLTDLNMGTSFRYEKDIIILTSIVHMNVTPSRCALTKYICLKSEVPELPGVNVGLCIDSDVYENEIKKVLPKEELFSLLGKQAKTLIIEGQWQRLDLKDIGEFLMDFPVLEQLVISFIGRVTCDNEELLNNIRFTQITSLIINTLIDQNTCDALFQLLPNLHEIMFLCPYKIVKRQPISFRMLPKLCVLKVADWNLVHLSEILDIPSESQESVRYELHGPSDTLSIQDERRIVNSGWNYFPKSEETLHEKYKTLYSELPEIREESAQLNFFKSC